MTSTLMLLMPVLLTGPAPARPIMGIVRFAARDPAHDSHWIAEVLTEGLRLRLDRLHRWRWADPDRVARSAAAEKPRPGEGRNRAWGVRVGKAAGVDVLVFGVFDRVGARVDVTLRMVRVATEENLGGVVVNGSVAHVLTLLSPLADAVLAGLELKLDATQQQAVHRPLTLVAQAAEWFGRALVLDRDPAQADKAEAAYIRALTFDSRMAEAHYRLGLLYRRRGDANRSLEHLRAAVAIDHEQPRYLSALAQGLAAAGQPVAAVARLKQASTFDPDWAQAYARLGHLYLQQGRHDEADTALRRAIALDPRVARPYGDLGNLLFVKGRLDEAAASYRLALERDPKLVEALNNLGTTHVQQGRLVEAAKQFKAAITVDPQSAHGHHNYARLLYAQGQLAEALPHARRATRLAPTDARVWLTLGRVLLRAGRVPESVPALQKALVLDRTGVIASQARLDLERIRQAHPELFRTEK